MTSDHVCSECDAEFGDAETMQEHYFTAHLVTVTGESDDVADTQPDGGSEIADSGRLESRRAGTRPEESGSSRVTRVEPSRPKRRLPDVLVALFLLVLLGIPATALVLALV